MKIEKKRKKIVDLTFFYFLPQYMRFFKKKNIFIINIIFSIFIFFSYQTLLKLGMIKDLN